MEYAMAAGIGGSIPFVIGSSGKEPCGSSDEAISDIGVYQSCEGDCFVAPPTVALLLLAMMAFAMFTGKILYCAHVGCRDQRI